MNTEAYTCQLLHIIPCEQSPFDAPRKIGRRKEDRKDSAHRVTHYAYGLKTWIPHIHANFSYLAGKAGLLVQSSPVKMFRTCSSRQHRRSSRQQIPGPLACYRAPSEVQCGVSCKKLTEGSKIASCQHILTELQRSIRV